MVGAGALLAVGKFRRVASIALLASLLPTTYAGHRFWEETDEFDQSPATDPLSQEPGTGWRPHSAAVDTEGRPSLTWRAKRTARLANQTASLRPAQAARGLRAAKDVVTTGENRLAALSTANRPASRTSRDQGHRADPDLPAGCGQQRHAPSRAGMVRRRRAPPRRLTPPARQRAVRASAPGRKPRLPANHLRRANADEGQAEALCRYGHCAPTRDQRSGPGRPRRQ